MMFEYATTYLSAVVDLVRELWFYMLIGFAIAGIVEEFVSEERLLKYFGENDLPALLRAAGTGFVVSACSCGAIPLAASLRDRGASTATTLTFLLASPWLGVPMLMVYVRFLGWTRTAGLIALAVGVALAAGMILARFERRGMIVQGKRVGVQPSEPLPSSRPAADPCRRDDPSCATEPEEHALPTLPRRLFVRVPRHGWRLGRDILPYLGIGVLIAALPRAFVGPATVSAWLGAAAGPWAVLTIIPVAAVIEACSEGFAVVGGQLYQQGASLAVVFVMSMVGVATDVTELSVLWKKFGKRTTLTYMLVGTGLTIAAGLVLQVTLR